VRTPQQGDVWRNRHTGEELTILCLEESGRDEVVVFRDSRGAVRRWRLRGSEACFSLNNEFVRTGA